MPQLDPSSYASQIFWLILCFSSLYFVVSALITPRLDDIMGKRQSLINGHINRANKFKEQAEEAFNKYEDSINKANYNASKNFAKAVDDMKDLVEKKSDDYHLEIAEKLQNAQQKITYDKDAAIKEIDNFTGKLAAELASRIGLGDIVNG